MASVAKRKWTHKGIAAEAWVVRYIDETGSRRSRQFEQKKQADAFKREAERELETGNHVARSQTVSVGRLCDDYMAAQEAMHRNGTIAQNTLSRRRAFVKAYIKPSLGDVLATELSRERIDGFIRHIRAKGRRRVSKGPELSPGTVKLIVQTLALVMDYGERRRLVAINHVRAVNRWPEHRRAAQAPIRTFTQDEVKHLLVSLEQRRRFQRDRSAVFTRALIYLAAFCGLRVGEILGLTWDAVDLEAGRLEVRHSLDAWDTLKGPKTRAGVRSVPMPSAVVQVITEWREHSVEDARGLIFRTVNGGPFAMAAIHTKYWRPALEAAGLGPNADDGRRFHFHALRHFAASMMVKSIPLADTAQLLGHKSFDITLQVYAHPVAALEHRREALEGASASIAPPRLNGATAPQQALTH